MAEYIIQGETLTDIADAIRSKTGDSSIIQPSQMASAISSISTGITVQRKTGQFTTGSSGTAKVNCGFKPDLIIIVGDGENYEGKYYEYNLVFAVNERQHSNYSLCASASSAQYCMLDAQLTETSSNGFSIYIGNFDNNWNYNSITRKSFNYIAIKYT